jgi:hypothetical protein
MPLAMPFTSRDLDAFPDDGKRYEIIDGELYVSGHPNYYHQLVCGNCDRRRFAGLATLTGVQLRGLQVVRRDTSDQRVTQQALTYTTDMLAGGCEY